jgi:hypothetical protein
MKWNSHARYLDLADDRRKAFSIILVGNMITESGCPFFELTSRVVVCRSAGFARVMAGSPKTPHPGTSGTLCRGGGDQPS